MLPDSEMFDQFFTREDFNKMKFLAGPLREHYEFDGEGNILRRLKTDTATPTQPQASAAPPKP